MWHVVALTAALHVQRWDLANLKADVLNEMLTFDAVGEPKTEPKSNPKPFKIDVGKKLSEMFPKWTILGVHKGPKMGPKRKL